MKNTPVKVAVFASGRGSNFKALIKAAAQKRLKKAVIALLVCDNPAAGAIAIARRAGISVAVVKRADFSSKADFEKEIIRQLKAHGIGLIALAGFMRMLGPAFVKKYRGRILNIHPALLPAFKGGSGIQDAFRYGVKVTGVTVHFVDEEMDHGPIILQKEVRIKEGDTLESLEARIHKVEHMLYPQALKLFSEGRLSIQGRNVRIR
jgi:phosphoribosylglycinamide formyltransferase 1